MIMCLVFWGHGKFARCAGQFIPARHRCFIRQLLLGRYLVAHHFLPGTLLDPLVQALWSLL